MNEKKSVLRATFFNILYYETLFYSFSLYFSLRFYVFV